MQISDLAAWMRELDEPGVAPLVAGLRHLLDSFDEIGLGYLSLDRPAGTLSGGEAQRTKMIRHLGSSLTDVTYVFDEPTIGLHPHDIQRMNNLLAPAARQGQHRARRRAQAGDDRDRRPRRRPRARAPAPAGGTICFEGTVEALRGSDTVTGRHLDDRARLKDEVRTPTGALEVRGASLNNLRDVDVDLPLGVLCVLTGVAGSGKSSLVTGSVAGRDGVVVIDQGAIRGSRRSNPATYTGLLEPVRKAFAKANGVKPALFSANSEGACPACKGAGVIFTELGVMATVESPCEECEGRRFQAAVLEYTLGGRNIAEVLAMPVTEAVAFFADGEARTPAAHKVLERLADVGLGYVSLGPAAHHALGRGAAAAQARRADGGEGRRLRARRADHRACTSPTSSSCWPCSTGWSTPGGRCMVIEHHQAVMAHADWIIDLGPGAGHDGGRVVFEGTPADLVAGRSTLTGEHLAAYVGPVRAADSASAGRRRPRLAGRDAGSSTGRPGAARAGVLATGSRRGGPAPRWLGHLLGDGGALGWRTDDAVLVAAPRRVRAGCWTTSLVPGDDWDPADALLWDAFAAACAGSPGALRLPGTRAGPDDLGAQPRTLGARVLVAAGARRARRRQRRRGGHVAGCRGAHRRGASRVRPAGTGAVPAGAGGRRPGRERGVGGGDVVWAARRSSSTSRPATPSSSRRPASCRVATSLRLPDGRGRVRSRE